MRNSDDKQRFYFWLLMVSCYIASLSFVLLYYLAGINLLAITGAIAFVLFLILTSLYFFVPLIFIFRSCVVIIFAAFYIQVFYTGGIMSPAVPEFFVASIIAFFYKPFSDRMVAITVAILATISMLVLSYLGLPQDLVPADYKMANSFICYMFVMIFLMLYVWLFRDSLIRKNKQLSKSITDLQNTTAKLIETEKMASIAMLSSGLAHELNNPLNYIAGLIRPIRQNLEEIKPLIQAKSREESQALLMEIEEYLDMIASGSGKAAYIIKKLIQISPQGAYAQTGDFDLSDTLQISSQIIKESHPEFDLEIQLQDKLEIHGNQVEINQLFVNIIENSVDAIKGVPNGLIKINGFLSNGHVAVTVEDNGKGMSDEIKNHLFEPFYTSKNPGEGTGLGLYISKSIANKFGGTIEVESTLNQGTSFKISFPRVESN